ncbi:hypothetical protein [Blastopirellula marina]|uniref:Type II secretion system protein GspG C-terminal domain-containing protein n=1 Tax=Blastopirellula marina DSM 3645 TaxID=314230 RepID=A3ZRT5_9BACT|nr:hypothetical protein [Blastopirellula marina]EAQ80854.1 hypothetical protein DSM3645_12576 [Blastopirellula marina DSM 3645]
MKKSTLYLLIFGGVALLVIVLLAWIIVGPSGPILISKQTTYLTEPLGRNGLVDYEKALVEIQAANISPAENAAIPYLQATWPCDLEPEYQSLVCDALQMPMPAADGMKPFSNADVRKATADWINQQAATKQANNAAEPFGPSDADLILTEALDIPWTRDQLSPLADWIDQQVPHFDKLHEMNARPKFFLPSPNILDGKYEMLLAALLPTVQHQRDAARSLSARAMLAIGENRPADAWEDIKTIFTLSRCHSQPGFLVEMLVSGAIRGMAMGDLLTLLNSGQCDAALLDKIEQFLAQIKPADGMAPGISTMERIAGLDAAISLSTHEINADAAIGSGDGSLNSLTYAPYDRNAMLRKLNQWYDRLAAAAEIDNLDDRKAAMDQLEIDIQAETQGAVNAGSVTGAIFNQSARGELIAKVLAGLLLPTITQAMLAEERTNSQLQLMRVAVALETYKVETGDYPDTLTPLAQRVDPALLQDPYSAGQLKYQKRPPGYLLYGVFQDRTDDGGNSQDGEIISGEWITTEPISIYPNGDQVIRLPMPKKSLSDVMPWNLPADDFESDFSFDETPAAEERPLTEPQATEPAALNPEATPE